MTAGGFYSNFEGALTCHLNLSNEQDKTLFDQLDNWFELLVSDNNISKALTADLQEQIISSGLYKIGDEDQSRRGDLVDDYDGIIANQINQKIFHSSVIPMSGRAPALGHRVNTAVKPNAESEIVGDTTSSASTTPPNSVLSVYWYKKLSPSDAQQAQSPNSKLTGNLKLTKAGHDIDQTVYFRQQMFAGALWATTGGKKVTEEAVVSFDVVIDSTDYGALNLKISHADSREAKQKNAPTWLHWGTLAPILKATSYEGSWLVLERRVDGIYSLEISGTAPSINS